MNANDIHEASLVLWFFLSVAEWLNPIVHLLGLGMAFRAFMRSKKWGYLIVALYFAACLFDLFAMPSIYRAIEARREPNISKQTQEKIQKAVQQTIDRVLEEEGRPAMAGSNRTISFPFGPILLVAGLWFIARHELRVDQSNEVTQPTTAFESRP